MNDQQTKTLNEFRDLAGVLNGYPAEIAKYAILQTKVGVFRDFVRSIEEVAKLTAADTRGVTQSKSNVKKEMATLSAELGAAALAYAHDQQDAELEGVFSLTYSGVYYAKDEDSLNTAQMLLDELEALDAEVRDGYLIFADDIARLEELTTQFAGLSETQGGKQADTKKAHKKLNILFKNTKELLTKSVDRLMLRLKRREPDMVEAYFNARSQGNLHVETDGLGSGSAIVTE